MDVNAALDKFAAILAKTDALNTQCNEQLRAVTGAMIGAAFAFSGPKKVMRFNNFMKKAIAMLGKSAIAKHKKAIVDYLTHMCGIVCEDKCYAVGETADLQKGADALKTASLITYKSEETQQAEKAAKDERDEKKQAYIDATAHQRVLMQLLTMKKTAEEKKAKLAKVTDLSKRNSAEIKKTGEELETIEALINYMDQRAAIKA